MQIKQIALLWFIATILYSCSGPVALNSIEDMPELKPEEFAIFPWGETRGDPNALKEIRECGFNLAGFVEPQHLDLVSEAGLKCIVHDRSTHVNETAAQLDEKEIFRRVEEIVERVGQHKAVFGYFLSDEPGARLFPGLKKWMEAYRKTDPKALAYINLFPNYTPPAKMNVPAYAEYLGSYVDTVQPKLISYDHYALMEDGSLRDGYFQNLEAVRLESLRSGLPFWNVVLANAHNRYADPTEAGLRFQLYTTLAYGARGIGYFTYFTPNEQFRSAPIDKFGHKTRTWDMLRSVNLQAHRLGHIYVKLRSVNVFHYPDVPQGCSGLGTSRFIASVGGGSLLVGEFEGPGGRPFVIVVNKSLQHTIDLDIKFKDAGQIQQVSTDKGQIEPWGHESNRLAAGQGLLLFLKQ